MKLLEILRLITRTLKQQNCKYCLVGGHAASLYRAQERVTKDIDFALMADTYEASRAVAEKVIKKIGLKPILGFIPKSEKLSGKRARSKNICFVTSAPERGEQKGIIDILLPDLPWVKEAVERAQYNEIDLGFAAVPVITPEDLILAKCYALNNNPDRFQDLDDLKEIFENQKDLDLEYISEKLIALETSIPREVRKYSPIKTERR